MTVKEFSDQFDVLYNNITSNQAPGLTEYEKSVFLTKAQTQLVREYFNVRIDSVGGGFDGSQKRQYDFSSLIRTENLYYVNSYVNRDADIDKLDKRSRIFLLPKDYFLSVNEIISDGHFQYSVLPIDYAEYQRLMLKPYNFPVKRAAWRLNTNKMNCNYWNYYIPLEDSFNEEYDSMTEYKFMSTWADAGRSLKITIVSVFGTLIEDSDTTLLPNISSDGNSFCFYWNDALCKILVVDNGGDSSLTYNFEVRVFSEVDLDDKNVIEVLKEGFRQYSKLVNVSFGSSYLSKVCNCTDGFCMASAPSDVYKFGLFYNESTNADDGGITFDTKVIQVPTVEIIGKFKGNIQYRMRYVRTLEPIILENLTNYGDDLKIEGVTQVTECKLPVECHEELLERAVTLAKIAWQGGTATQAQAASRERDRDR